MFDVSFRKLALRLYRKHKSFRKASKILEYSVHFTTICRWSRNIFPKKKVRRSLSNKNRLLDSFVFDSFKVSPIYTQEELLCLWKQKYPFLSCSRQSISRSIQRILYTKKRVKKKYTFFTHPDKQAHKRIFNVFQDTSSNLFFLDESSFTNHNAKRSGYSLKGTECVIPPSKASSFRASLILGSTYDGQISYSIHLSSVKSKEFLIYLQGLELPCGTTIIMDNCSIHKTKEVDSYIQSRGWKVLFLPTYSPDLNPIELVFAKLKVSYRKTNLKDRNTIESLVKGIECSFIRSTFDHVKNACSSKLT